MVGQWKRQKDPKQRGIQPLYDEGETALVFGLLHSLTLSFWVLFYTLWVLIKNIF